MVQHGIEGGMGRGPFGHQVYGLAHGLGQARVQRAGVHRPDGAAAHGQHRGQLGQPVFVGRGKAQHGGARRQRIDIALARGALEFAGVLARQQGLQLAAGRGQLGRAGLRGPLAQLGKCRGRMPARGRGGVVGGRGTGGQRALEHVIGALRQQAVEVQRPAGLGPGARQAFAAERLNAHHGAHHVAVHIDIARVRRGHHLGNGLVYARVQAQRQAVAGGVDLREQLRQILAAVAHDVQHRAEDLALQFGDAVQLDQRGQHKRALGQRRVAGIPGAAQHLAALGPHLLDVLFYAVTRLGIDHRADVDGQLRRVADAALRDGAAEHFNDAVGAVFLQAQHAQRRAALARAVERRGNDIGHHLFGQRRRVDNHRVLAAGLGHQHHGLAVAPQALGQLALQNARDIGGAREQHALHARVGDQRRAHALALAGQQLHHGLGHAGLPQAAQRMRGHQRRLLGGLGQHRIARGQRGADLANEDGQREIPGADADHRAQRAVGGDGEIGARLGRVIPQEINGFAHFGNGIGRGLAGFARQQTHELRHVGFQQIGRAFQRIGAQRGRRLGPAVGGAGRGGKRGLHILLRRLLHPAHEVLQIGGIADLHAGAALRRDAGGQHGRCRPVAARLHGRGNGLQRVLVGKIESARIRARRAVERDRQRDRRVGQAVLAFRARHALQGLHRVFDQRFQRHGRVGNAVHKRGVGAVFQQPAHQVGEQRLVRAHGGVDAAGPAEAGHHLFVQRLAHAVQALEFILARPVGGGPGHLVNGRDGVRIVRGELREDFGRRFQQLARAGQVGDIGMRLARVDRIAVLAVHLGALDLAVPVRALDQAHHEPVAAAPGQIDQEVDHGRAALLIGLDHKAYAVPARERGLEAQALEQIERQLEPVGFLGIDVEPYVVLPGLHGQRQHARVELLQHARVLRAAVARVQRRQLDRDARAGLHARAGRGLAYGVYGLLVVGKVAPGIAFGQRGFAQHVVRVAKAPGLEAPGMLQGRANRLAGNELLAHHAHRHVDTLAYQRLAALADDASQRAGQAGLAVRGDQPAREQQAPGGGIDKQRGAAAQVLAPVAVGNLVAYQRVARGGIGNAQQCLGQAHQCHALLRRQRIFLQQALHHARAAAGALALAQSARQLQRQHVGALRVVVARAREFQQGRHHGLGFGPARRGRDGVAQRAAVLRGAVDKSGGRGRGSGNGHGETR